MMRLVFVLMLVVEHSLDDSLDGLCWHGVY
jgi:hypothetical protein